MINEVRISGILSQEPHRGTNKSRVPYILAMFTHATKYPIVIKGIQHKPSEIWETLNIGDMVELKGKIQTGNAGSISVLIDDLKLLKKT